jgi:hypothetical protein
MGKSAAETVREIEATRTRLDHDLQELQDRMPAPAVWTKRLVGVALGGGAAGSAFWFVVRRLKKRRRAKDEAKRLQAVVQVLPEEWAKTVSKAMEDGRWKGWAGAAAGLWLFFRLAELRQLRRMNRVVVTRSAA